MLKLLIVDDEIFVRRGIKNSIDWTSIGYEVVAEAEDGEKALELSRMLKPDVILTDIQMPKMNGLELIKVVQKEIPDCKIVVLSCHQDYKYMREAMQYGGVVDYVLKLSVEPEDLVKVMLKVAEGIDAEKMERHELLKVKCQLNSNMYVIRNNYFHKLLLEGVEEVELKQKIGDFIPELVGAEFTVLCFRPDRSSLIKAERTGLLLQTIYSHIDTVICMDGRVGCTFSVREGEFSILLVFQRYEEKREEKLEGLCRKINQSLEENFKVTASFGIGKLVMSLVESAYSYCSARDALAGSFFDGKSSISFYNKCNFTNNVCFFDKKQEKLLWSYLDSEDFSGASKMISELLLRMKGNKSYCVEIIKAQLQEILDTFSVITKNFNFRFRDLKDIDGDDPYISISKCENLDDILEWFEEFIKRFSDYCRNSRPFLMKKEICCIMEYIEKNYSMDINLKDMAKLVHMNETYLSSLFKNETGQYFADYVKRVRIGKAKEFIRKNGYSISEAAEKVGFISLSYFGKVFRQQEGMNPAEYRKRSRGIV